MKIVPDSNYVRVKMKLLARTVFTALALSAVSLSACAIPGDLSEFSVGLLERGLQQGDKAYIEAHVAQNYIQHNPIAEDGRAGMLVEQWDVIQPIPESMPHDIDVF